MVSAPNDGKWPFDEWHVNVEIVFLRNQVFSGFLELEKSCKESHNIRKFL